LSALRSGQSPRMRNKRNNRSSDRSRQARVSLPSVGVPMPSPGRHPILDDALLGSAWRWDADDERSSPAR